MRILLAAVLLAAATPVLADTTAGKVVAFDRKANILVMDDKTIWQMSDETAIPETLGAGDEISISFTSYGDDGVTIINESST